MEDDICNKFQKTVEQYLIRHQSILDILSKSQETNALVSRAVIKAVTQCGCLQVHSEKVRLPENATFEDFKNAFSSHLEGQLCEHCGEIIEQEIGKNLFYLTALCNALGLDLNKIIDSENKKVQTLRVFNLT